MIDYTTCSQGLVNPRQVIAYSVSSNGVVGSETWVIDDSEKTRNEKELLKALHESGDIYFNKEQAFLKAVEINPGMYEVTQKID